MDRRSSSVADNHLYKEFPVFSKRFETQKKFHYRGHKNRPLNPNVSQIQALMSHFFSVRYFMIVLLYTSLSCAWSLTFTFSYQNCLWICNVPHLTSLINGDLRVFWWFTDDRTPVYGLQHHGSVGCRPLPTFRISLFCLHEV